MACFYPEHFALIVGDFAEHAGVVTTTGEKPEHAPVRIGDIASVHMHARPGLVGWALQGDKRNNTCSYKNRLNIHTQDH